MVNFCYSSSFVLDSHFATVGKYLSVWLSASDISIRV